MARERTVIRGIVLRTVDTKESDKILTLLTPCGKLPVVAKGARSRRSRVTACTQLLAYGEFTLGESRGWQYLVEGSTLELFQGVRRDIALLSLASYFAELTEAVALEEHNGLWFCYENPEAWKRLMAVVESGEDPNSVDWLSDPAELAAETADEEVGVSQLSDDVILEETWIADSAADTSWNEPYSGGNSGDGYNTWPDAPSEPTPTDPEPTPSDEPSDVPEPDIPPTNVPSDVNPGTGDDVTNPVEPEPSPEPTPDPEPSIPEPPVDTSPDVPDVPSEDGGTEV